MNKWYGIRIQKSYSSDENWNAINEYGGRQLVLWSIPMLVAGVVLMALPVTLATGFAAIVVLVVCVAAPLVQVYLFSQELPEPRPADARPAAGHDAGQ